MSAADVEAIAALLGDRVLVVIRTHGRHREMDSDLEWKAAHVWTMRDGKAVELRGFSSPEDASLESGIPLP